MTTVSQRSFAAGEIDPGMSERLDQVKRATGLRTCRNNFIGRHGVIINRPGTAFSNEVENSAEAVKLVRFVFNADQTYVLQFGDLTIWIIKDNVIQREATATISAVTKANPAVVTTGTHSYSTGNTVFIDAVVGMTQLNGRSFKITVLSGTTYSLQDNAGTNIDSTAFTTYSSAGTSARVVEVVTPYLAAELNELHYIQSADVITITHPNHEPRDLSRTSDILWALNVITFLPDTTHPTGALATAGTGTANVYKYKVTAIDPDTDQESLPGVEAATTITGATAANPVVISVTGHGYENDDTVLITGVVGMTELNNRRFTVAGKNTNDFQLKEENGSSYTAYVSGGSALREDMVVSSNAPTVGTPITLAWTAVTGVKQYNVYRAFKNSYGFLQITDRPSFNDTDEVTEDTTDAPPADRDPFLFSGNFPSTVTYHQQRRIFANTDNKIEDVFASASTEFKNFTKGLPQLASDAVFFNLSGLQVNEVQSMVQVSGTLMMMTTGAEVAITGNTAGILVPGEINPKEYSSNGSNKLQPMKVNGSIVYVQARGNVVRSLDGDGTFENFVSDDLTLFSPHLFEGSTVVDMAFQKIPHSIAWFVMSDGALLGATILKEQEVLGWHRHDFDGGTVENVITIPEGTADALYVVVKRTINGKTTKYVERFTPRIVADVEDYKFMDSSVTEDGTNTAATTMTLTTGSGWLSTDDLTLTSSVAHFVAADVGVLQIHLKDSTGAIIRLKITAFTSTTVVTVRANRTVPTTMRTTALTTWGDARKTISNLWHLEDKKVSVFGDGFVNASPNNPSYTAVTVTNGIATLDNYFVVRTAGLPFISDVETLNVDTDQAETLADKKSITNQITLGLKDTRGLWAGHKPPTDDTVDALENLVEFKPRSDEGYDVPPKLLSENINQNIISTYTNGARGFIRQIEPLPSTILAIHLSGKYPFREG